MGASADPRVQRTRAAIAEAVAGLTAAGEPITVASIAREAGISRASFYSHYASLDELALSLMRDSFVSIADLWRADPDAPTEAMRTSQQRLVAHFAANRGLYSAYAAMPVSKENYLAAVRTMAAVIEPTLTGNPGAGDVPAAARYIAGAAYGLIDAWLTDDIALTDEALVDQLVRMLPPWFGGLS